jgi:hypothetical protein
MKESAMWRTLRTGLLKAEPKIFLQRHEDKLINGLPDVHYCYKGRNGWIELKYLKEFPKKKNTPISIKHLTEFQLNWINNYLTYGGHVWILLRIEKEILLIKGVYAQRLKNILREDLYTICANKWLSHKMDYKELVKTLLLKPSYHIG